MAEIVAGPPRTARDGKADWSQDGATWVDIPHVRKVGFTPSTDVKEYASSSTGGAKRRLEGVDDFDGTIDVYIDNTNRFDAAAMGIRSGAAGFIRAYEARADVPFIMPVHIASVVYGIEIEDGNILGATINFNGDGPITYPDGAPPPAP